MRYSPSTRCFYPEAMKYPKGVLPADLITVSDDDHRRALTRPSNTVFNFTVSGQLVVSAGPVPPTKDELAAEAAKNAALEALRVSDVVVVRCYERSLPVPTEWVTYRDELRKVVNGERTELPTAPGAPNY